MRRRFPHRAGVGRSGARRWPKRSRRRLILHCPSPRRGSLRSIARQRRQLDQIINQAIPSLTLELLQSANASTTTRSACSNPCARPGFARRLPLPTPNHAMTRYFPTFLDLDFLISDLQPNRLCLSAPPERRDRTTEQPTMQAFFANDRNAQRRRGGATCDEPHTVDSTL